MPPVIISEILGDSGGGAPGDGTYLLRALLEANAPNTAFGFITEADVAGTAREAGAVIRADAPGATTSPLSNLPHQRMQRPAWPLDELEFVLPGG